MERTFLVTGGAGYIGTGVFLRLYQYSAGDHLYYSCYHTHQPKDRQHRLCHRRHGNIRDLCDPDSYHDRCPPIYRIRHDIIDVFGDDAF